MERVKRGKWIKRIKRSKWVERAKQLKRVKKKTSQKRVNIFYQENRFRHCRAVWRYQGRAVAGRRIAAGNFDALRKWSATRKIQNRHS
jgi:hypothetical protein